MVITSKIPVRIDLIDGDVEISMGLNYFESSGTSIRTDIKTFKKDYLEAIRRAKDADSASSGTRRVTTTQRWRACKILADFNRAKANKFVITNYKEAYARDFGIPLRSIREYLDFGDNFTETEILDRVPFSLYAELVFRINGLKERGLFESEKAKLASMDRNDSIPNRDEYRRHLKDLLADSN